jgi:PAS domain S-box-containing protein
MQSRAFSRLPVIGLLTLVYFIAGKLGLMLASLQASASPVWPPAGIALAALLVLGYRAWPAIFVGAFLVNVTTAGNVATSLAIASGNTLEALFGAWLVNRFAGGTTVFDRPQGVVKFALAAVVSTVISPAFGVTSLALGGFADWANFGAIWLTWWLGDTTGDLLIAPLIILWSIASKRRWNRREAVELGILLLLLFVFSEAVFCGWLTISARNYPIAFISLAIVIWTAFRFTQRETATGIFILSAIAIWGTMHGFGPFVGETENQSLLALQSWTAGLTITAMALSAGMAERGRAEEALRESEASMSLAANAANLGLWVWNIPGGDERWVTEKWRQLFGFADSEPVTFDRFLEVVHPGDSERVKQVVQHMLEHGGEYEIDYRITRPDGSIRWIATHGSVELDERGKPVLARGVSRDITKRKIAEEELRESEARFRTVANAAPVMIWMSGPDKLCTFFNKSWLEFTGRSLEQEMGNGWSEGVHPDDLQRSLKIYSEAFDAQQPFVMQYRLRRHDGEYRWISDNGVPRYDPHKNFAGYIGSCIDITDLLSKEQALRDSKERMSLAASAARLVVWTWDIRRDEVWLSEKDRALFGFSQGEKLNAERTRSVVHPEDRQLVRQLVENSLTTHKEIEAEYRVVLADGSVQWVTRRGRVEFDSDGKPIWERGVLMDITERKQAEEKFRLALDAAPNAMIMVDSAGVINFANASAATVFGYSLSELIGCQIEMLIPQRFRDRHPGYRKDFLSHPSRREMGVGRDLFGRRKDGSEFPVEVGLSPMATAQGVFVLASLIDITARKEAELEHERQNMELARVGRVTLMGELAASLAHEVNNPVGAMVANASAGQRLLAARKIGVEEMTELLADIAADGRRASEVIQGIRNMVRKGEARRSLVQIDDIIDNLLRIVRAEAVGREVKLAVEVDSDPGQVWGDSVQLLQVLLNLTINGFEAMTALPSDARRLFIRAGRDGNGNVLVSVRDSGPGFPSAIGEQLFEPFFSTKAEGTGMGLAIARSIVETHGGVLSGENCEDGGASFTICLPEAKEKKSTLTP